MDQKIANYGSYVLVRGGSTSMARHGGRHTPTPIHRQAPPFSPPAAASLIAQRPNRKALLQRRIYHNQLLSAN